MSNTKHTPTPWKVEREVNIYAEADGVHLATVWARHVRGLREGGESWIDMRDRTQQQREAAKAEWQANAAFIVRAANSHDQLVEALRAIVDAHYKEGSDVTAAIVAARDVLVAAEAA